MKNRLLLLTALAVVVGGCSMYEPLEIVPDHIRTIYIHPFENKTQQIRLSEEVTREVVNEFIRDGRFSISDRDTADSILSGTIVEYRNIPISFDENFIAEEYSLSIIVNLSFTDSVEQLTLWREEWDELKGGLEARVRYYVGTQRAFTETEDDARERLLEELADAIVRRTVYGWR